MKRKACYMDDDGFGSNSYPSSSPSSTGTGETNASPDFGGRAWQFPSLRTYTHINTRTSKRWRDSRPSEQVIHDNTIAKLFQAQRRLEAEASFERNLWPLNNAANTQYADVALTSPVHETKQKTLHAFFGGSDLHNRSVQPYAGQGKSHHPFGAENNHSVSARCCEDCGNTLNNTLGLSNDSLEFMDVDSAANEYSCVQCRRCICDLCSVKGNYRVCLECAMPGGGSSGS